MAALVLGPLLRYVGATEATVWVETDAPCEVEVLGARERTFRVGPHHYALVHVEGLEPGTTTPYEVALDGERAWPQEGSPFPPSVIRTPGPDEEIEVIWGSCRVALPHEPPFTLACEEDARGHEIDAVYAYALRMLERPPREWPHLMIWLGDQVYADEASPHTREFIRTSRDARVPPHEEVANFMEYRCLYHESWGEPITRWLLSTVPSTMIFDDHDVHDDWNTSAAWVRDMRAQPWWEERIVGAFSTYWLYQHLGNLSPRELAEDELYARVREADDGEPLLREAARGWDATTDGSRWSYCRDIGGTRIVVVDSRAGRVLEGTRRMVDDEEWDYIVRHCTGDFEHLVIATTLPFVLPHGWHWLEAFDEKLAGGRFGKRGARLGEWLRQRFDLEHWAAFEDSFLRVVELVREVGAGERGRAPATIAFLSGDVHNAYVAEVEYPAEAGMRSRVYQGVCSPIRNPLSSHERRAVHASSSRAFAKLVHWLAMRAGVQDPGIEWRLAAKPTFDNQIATLEWRGEETTLRIERALAGEGGRPRLETSFEQEL